MAGRKKQLGPVNYFELPRKQLQALCKKHGFPANKTNVSMAEFLTDHLRSDDSVNNDASPPSPATVKPAGSQEIDAKITRHPQKAADDSAPARSDSEPKGNSGSPAGEFHSTSPNEGVVADGEAEKIERKGIRQESASPQKKAGDDSSSQGEQMQPSSAAESKCRDLPLQNEETNALPLSVSTSEQHMDFAAECSRGRDSPTKSERLPPPSLLLSDAEIVASVTADAEAKSDADSVQETPLPLSVIPRVCFYTPPKATSPVDGRHAKKTLFQDLMADGFPRMQRGEIQNDSRVGGDSKEDTRPPSSCACKPGSFFQSSQESRSDMGSATADTTGASPSIMAASFSFTPKRKFSLRSSPPIPAIFPSPRSCTRLFVDPLRDGIVEEWTADSCKENESKPVEGGFPDLGGMVSAVRDDYMVLSERDNNSLAGELVDLHERRQLSELEVQNPPKGIVDKVRNLFEVEPQPHSLLSRKVSGYKTSPFWKSSRVAAELERATKLGQARRIGILAQKRGNAGSADWDSDDAKRPACGEPTGSGPAPGAISDHEMDTTGGQSPSIAAVRDQRSAGPGAILDSERESPDPTNSRHDGNWEEDSASGSSPPAAAPDDAERNTTQAGLLSSPTTEDTDVVMTDRSPLHMIHARSDPVPAEADGALHERQSFPGEMSATPSVALPVVSSLLADQTVVTGGRNGCPTEMSTVIRPRQQTEWELAGQEEPTWRPPTRDEDPAGADLSWMSKPIRVHLRRLSPPHPKHSGGRSLPVNERKLPLACHLPVKGAEEEVPPPPPALLCNTIGARASQEEATELRTLPFKADLTNPNDLHAANRTPARHQPPRPLDFLSSIERSCTAHVVDGGGATNLEEQFTPEPAARGLRIRFPQSEERKPSATPPSTKHLTGFLAIDFTKAREKVGAERATAALSPIDSNGRTAALGDEVTAALPTATTPSANAGVLVRDALRESDASWGPGLGVTPGKENEWTKRREQHKTPLTGRSMQKSLRTVERNTTMEREDLLRQRRGMARLTENSDSTSVQSSPLKQWTIINTVL